MVWCLPTLTGEPPDLYKGPFFAEKLEMKTGQKVRYPFMEVSMAFEYFMVLNLSVF